MSCLEWLVACILYIDTIHECLRSLQAIFFSRYSSFLLLPCLFPSCPPWNCTLDRPPHKKADISIYLNAIEKNQSRMSLTTLRELNGSELLCWGINDGLVSVESLMMCVGAEKKVFKAICLAGFAGLVAGA